MKKKDKHHDETAAQLKRESAELLSENPQAYEAFVEMMKDKSLLGVGALVGMGEVTGLDTVVEKLSNAFVGDVVVGNPDEAAKIPDTFEGEYSELMEDDSEEDWQAFIEVLSQIEGMQGMAQALKALNIKGQTQNLLRTLMATWINCGEAFETMLDHVGDYIDHEEASTSDKKMLEHMVRFVVRTSMDTGRRTPEQWEVYAAKVKNVKNNPALAFAVLQAIRPTVPRPQDVHRIREYKSLKDFIVVHSDKVINQIGNELFGKSKGEDIALLIIALDELKLLHSVNVKGIVEALQREFPDYTKSARTVQEKYNELTTVLVEVEGQPKRILMKNTDKYRMRIEGLKRRFREAIDE